MAKTQLNLKLIYKGKHLDTAKDRRDFTNKLYIGSDKFLFWQILDEKFPKKFLFLQKKGEQFYLNLHPDMHVEFQDNGQTIDANALKAKKLLSDNQVLLSKDMTGSVKIGNDWMIKYEFVEPWKKILTEEEKQIIHQYARRTQPTRAEKANRNFMLISLVIVIAGLIAFSAFSKRNEGIETLQERLKRIQEVATKVEIPISELTRQFSEERVAPTPQETKAVTEGTSTPGVMSKAAAKAALSNLLGPGGFQPGQTGSAMTFAVTTEENIVAASLGGAKGGGGSGGKGKGAGASGDGSGFGDVFDPSEVVSGTTHLAGLASGRPQGKLSTQAPVGDVTTYVGDVGRIVPVGKPGTKVGAGVISRFGSPDVKKVAEGGIAAAPPDTRPELQKIQQRVDRYKPQIKDQFNRYSQIKSMYGSLKFTLYIENDGSVSGVLITNMSGEFYSEFLNALEQLIKGWKFDNKTLVQYEFIMTFQG